MGQTIIDHDFVERLKLHTADIFDEQYKNLVKRMYYLEEKWSNLICDEYLNSRMRKQQECLWEFLSTERNYICRMRVIVEVFQQVFRIAQREGDLLDFNSKEIFANIDQVLLTNDTIWRDYLVKVLNKTRKKKRPIKPSELLAAFTKTEELYESYVEFCILQDGCLKRIREYSNGNQRENTKKARFKVYLDFCEDLVQSERYKLVDLMTEPMQRVTRYPLLLKSILDNTENPQEKKQLQNMIKTFESFLVKINTRLRIIHEKNKLENTLEEFEEYNTWAAGNEDVIWGCVDFLRSEVSKVKEPRCLLERGTVKLIDKKGKSEMNVEMLLFTDVIVFARKRTSTKKLVVIKQLHFLDRTKFIRSEISPTSIVVLYLDEHGMLANALMLEMAERDRDKWMDEVTKAQDRYENAKSGCGSTLEFFQDNIGANDDNISTVAPPRKTSELVKSVEVTRRASVDSRKSLPSRDSQQNLNKNVTKKDEASDNTSMISRKSSLRSVQTIENYRDDVFEITRSGIDRRSASWLLTEEKKVHSIRTLLREDLWGNYVKVKPSFSFRSEASDSGISMSESFNSRKSNGSPVNTPEYDDIEHTLTRVRANANTASNKHDCSVNILRNPSSSSFTSQKSERDSLVRNESSSNITLQKNDTSVRNESRAGEFLLKAEANVSSDFQYSIRRSNMATHNGETSERVPSTRKISSCSSILPGISEHIYTEMTFLPRSEIKDQQQRRSVKTVLSNDQNNNREKPDTHDQGIHIVQHADTLSQCSDDVHSTSDDSIVSSSDIMLSLNDNDFDTPESYLENR